MLEEKRYKVEYSSNNSGGGWWLSDADWAKLEAEGWYVEWLGKDFCNSKYRRFGPETAPNTCPEGKCPGHRRAESFSEAEANGYRHLGALATSATIEITAYSSDLAEGVASNEWQNIVGQDPEEQGCNCCGHPHSFWADEIKDA